MAVGNKSTLGAEAAAAAGVEVRPALLAYRERFYRTDAMALVLISSPVPSAFAFISFWMRCADMIILRG